VHSIVSFDFATSIVPGWHTTIFPPYFVAGAIFGGFAMVLTLMLPARIFYPQIDDIVTRNHVDKMAKIILLTGSIVGYAYATEFFSAWYGGNLYERYHFINRATGPYAFGFYLMVLCNALTPQLFWFKRIRNNVWILFVASILVNIGMWFERFVIIVVSLHRAFLPSGWGMFYPTLIDFGILVGSFGLFFTLFLLFIRFAPMVAMWEVKSVVTDQMHADHGEGASHG
jgi:molybdopterin-containing oxidoreductase family membrane subunit